MSVDPGPRILTTPRTPAGDGYVAGLHEPLSDVREAKRVPPLRVHLTRPQAWPLALQLLIHNPTAHAAVYPAPMPVHSAGDPPAVSIIAVGLHRVVWVDRLGQLDFLAFCYFLIDGNIVRLILYACVGGSLGFSHAQRHGSCDTDT